MIFLSVTPGEKIHSTEGVVTIAFGHDGCDDTRCLWKL